MLTLEQQLFHVDYIFCEYTKTVKDQFSIRFPSTPVPNQHSLKIIIKKFGETGCIKGYKRSGRSSILWGTYRK